MKPLELSCAVLFLQSVVADQAQDALNSFITNADMQSLSKAMATNTDTSAKLSISSVIDKKIESFVLNYAGGPEVTMQTKEVTQKPLTQETQTQVQAQAQTQEALSPVQTQALSAKRPLQTAIQPLQASLPQAPTIPAQTQALQAPAQSQSVSDRSDSIGGQTAGQTAGQTEAQPPAEILGQAQATTKTPVAELQSEPLMTDSSHPANKLAASSAQTSGGILPITSEAPARPSDPGSILKNTHSPTTPADLHSVGANQAISAAPLTSLPLSIVPSDIFVNKGPGLIPHVSEDLDNSSHSARAQSFLSNEAVKSLTSRLAAVTDPNESLSASSELDGMYSLFISDGQANTVTKAASLPTNEAVSAATQAIAALQQKPSPSPSADISMITQLVTITETKTSISISVSVSVSVSVSTKHEVNTTVPSVQAAAALVTDTPHSIRKSHTNNSLSPEPQSSKTPSQSTEQPPVAMMPIGSGLGALVFPGPLNTSLSVPLFANQATTLAAHAVHVVTALGAACLFFVVVL